MTELRDDLDRALRSVTIGEAPVQRAMRAGRRLRTRRRVAVLAGALATAVVAAVSPSLARPGAAPAPPAANPTATPVPSATGSSHRDPVVTDQPPAAGAAAGTIAQGTIGGRRWAAALSGSGLNPHSQALVCYTAYVALTAAAPASGPSAQLLQDCVSGAVDAASHPAGLTGRVTGAATSTSEQVVLGVVASDVTYFALTFTDGQQLKLIPVSWQGQRYIAWIAPAAMTVAGLTAHLGSPNFDSGQTMTAVPFQPAGSAPLFGLWLKPGQPAAPRAGGVIGHGTAGGPDWSASAYEGPWGTCFIPSLSATFCLQETRLGGTAVLGGWGSDPAAAFGSAAPGVALLKITLSNGKSVQVRPVTVGNERLFAFWPGVGVWPTGWTSYDAAGRVTGTHSMTSSSAPGSMPPWSTS
jgi:hypothetical protein